MLRSDLCDYSDMYIVVKETIDLLAANENDEAQKDVAFKNKTLFKSSISKIKGTTKLYFMHYLRVTIILFKRVNKSLHFIFTLLAIEYCLLVFFCIFCLHHVPNLMSSLLT